MQEQSHILELFERYILHQTTLEENVELIRWIQNNPRLLQYMETELSKTSDWIDPEIARRNLEKIYQVIRQEQQIKIDAFQHSERRKPTFLYRFLRIAAIFLLPLVTGVSVYWLMKDSFEKNPLSVVVAKGQKVQIELPDGTLVWLNADSRISYGTDYNRKERSVELLGEGFFEVTPNPASPFKVRAYEMEVEALGTAFLVKAYDNGMVSTVLREGRTKVTTPNGEVFMNPNERVEYDRKTRKQVKQEVFDAMDYMAWIYNSLRFEDESFEQIMRSIERSYNVKIIVKNRMLLNRKFTGTVPNNGVESILKCISLSVPISYKIEENTVYIE